jgi:hypothetical protein
MMEPLIVLAVLFGALVLLIPLIKRSKTRLHNRDVKRLSKSIYVLLGILILLALYDFAMGRF